MVDIYVSYPYTVGNDLPTESRYYSVKNRSIIINQFKILMKLYYSLRHYTENKPAHTDKFKTQTFSKNEHVLAWNKLIPKSSESIERQNLYVSLYELLADSLVNDRQFIKQLKLLIKKDRNFIRAYRLAIICPSNPNKYDYYQFRSATEFCCELDAMCDYVDDFTPSFDMVPNCYANLMPKYLEFDEYAEHLTYISKLFDITPLQAAESILNVCQALGTILVVEIHELADRAIQQRALHTTDGQLVIKYIRNVFDLAKHNRAAFLKYSKLNDLTLDYLSTVN